jgi:hypothetical protein
MRFCTAPTPASARSPRGRSSATCSTHDLSLAQAADLAAHSQPFYFTEQFSRGEDGPIMEFDYQLRPGLAPSTNALKLMEIVGLPLNEAQTI